MWIVGGRVWKKEFGSWRDKESVCLIGWKYKNIYM